MQGPFEKIKEMEGSSLIKMDRNERLFRKNEKKWRVDS
jgi:hypothetical protein